VSLYKMTPICMRSARRLRPDKLPVAHIIFRLPRGFVSSKITCGAQSFRFLLVSDRARANVVERERLGDHLERDGFPYLSIPKTRKH